MANRLAESLSPYLRQHADNPVDWREWGPEAFAEARRRDVPVFLSIGYAACHWCHVMAHESFSDPEVARVLNAGFVPVKVDREERPDVDAIYMDVTIALTGQGGWPMSVWLTPDGHAFHAGTYFPPAPHPNLPSFTQVLDAVTEAWQQRRQQVLDGAAAITDELAARSAPPEPGTVTAADVDQAVGLLAAQADDRHGGFGTAPKFPPSTVIDALLRRAAQADGPVADEAWRVASHVLGAMARGGIHDQLGGGFARYSVDAGWVVPHFEKMLYDNALLLGGYARGAVEAARRGDHDLAALCERVVTDTVGWLQREMTTPEGGLAASLDADSPDATGHPQEGAFYVWTPAQLRDVLGDDDGDRAAALLGVTEAGTFEGGASTLRLLAEPDDAAWFAGVRERLLAARAQRPRPARDDKVVAAWNGWAVVSLVEAAVLLDRPAWLEPARRAAHLLRTLHVRDGRVARVSLSGRLSPAPGTADDHGAVAHAFLALAAVDGDPSLLADALALLRTLDTAFVADDGGLHDTADDGEQLVRRPRDVAENATPNGSSAALHAYRWAYRLTGDHHWRDRADAVARTLGALVTRAPRAAGWGLADAVAEVGARRPVEVAIVGPDGDDRGALVRTAWREAPPGSIVAVGDGDGTDRGVPLLAHRTTTRGAPTAYVCHDQVCDLPVTTLELLRQRLG
ncbi:MAG TPA: thioredoxin domain-containing protein [Actinotalea caeni]|uniref:thioredoxin domain-containing protein n=1 Tax=Actinotalea caeni TaxID=1348467 RepID=UPI002B4B5FA3|nr:thioredoxin domain-containing protein [Actinotalea caeni]HLV56290.1 thioredoxin domain-containing protein [Actinotalea caeni]